MSFTMQAYCRQRFPACTATVAAKVHISDRQPLCGVACHAGNLDASCARPGPLLFFRGFSRPRCRTEYPPCRYLWCAVHAAPIHPSHMAATSLQATMYAALRLAGWHAGLFLQKRCCCPWHVGLPCMHAYRLQEGWRCTHTYICICACGEPAGRSFIALCASAAFVLYVVDCAWMDACTYAITTVQGGACL